MDGIDFGELYAVDVAFGHYVAQAFSAVDPAGKSGQLAEFLNRESGQVWRTEFETPEDVLKEISGGKDQQVVTAPDGYRRNIPNVPVVAYHRPLGIRNTDSIGETTVRPTVVSDGSGGFLEFRLLPVELTYRLIFIGFRRLVLDQMQMIWYAHQIHRPKFEIPFLIDGVPQDVTVGTVAEKRAIQFEDVSVAENKGKSMRAVQAEIVVQTVVAFGAPVVVPAAVSVSTTFIGYCVRV